MTPTTVPLVLIHGIGLDHTMWLPVMSALSHRRTIAFDMIGHGSASKPDGPYSLDMFVDQLSGIVDVLKCDVDLVGFSMGALVARGFALSPAGTWVRRMVLLNGVYDRTATEQKAIMDRLADVRAGGFAATVEPALQRWFTPAFVAAQPAIVESVRRRLLDNDIQAYANAYEVFATADAELAPRAADIAVPTLVATGGEDQRSTPTMATALAAAMPHGCPQVLPGLRHLTPVEAPDVVAEMIDEFTRQ
ncbi:MAG: alpha/beta fold hydrolase [Actinomycetota bacterium]|nr:alpha/beta fold hydrolase [Actinomycetota bacterium]